jgi:hypothetical protein
MFGAGAVNHIYWTGRATRGTANHICSTYGEISRRPPIDFPDIKILACLEKELFHSGYSLAAVLHVSYSTI